MISPLRITTVFVCALCGELPIIQDISCVALHLYALSTCAFLHLCTYAHMFINFSFVRDLYVKVVVWTCQTPIRGHVAGFSRILTFKYVCFSMSVTPLLCFHNVHLVGWRENTSLRRWLYRLCTFDESVRQQEKQRIIPPAPACFPKRADFIT